MTRARHAVTDRSRACRLAGAIATVALSLGAGSGAMRAGAAPVDEPVATAPDTSEPDTSEPDTSEPGTSEPPVTAPPSAEAPGSSPSPADGDDSINTTAAVLGAIGFIGLIAVAGWWMVRLRDDDDAPHPRPSPLDEPLPGQDLL